MSQKTSFVRPPTDQQSMLVAIQWLWDIHQPDMVEVPGYRTDYLTLKETPFKEIKYIAHLLNRLHKDFKDSPYAYISFSGIEITTKLRA